MNREEFDQGIERLAGNWGEERITPGLIREIKDRYFTLSPIVWRQAITLILDRCRYAPRMKDFREVLDSLRSESSRAASSNPAWCDQCDQGFLKRYMLSRGQPYEVVVPCSCHPHPPKYENEYTSDSRTFIEEAEYRQRVKAIREKNSKMTHNRLRGITEHETTMDADPGADDERTDIAAYEAEAEAEDQPPPSW